MHDLAEILKEYQAWVVGVVGALVHVILRPDVPWWHHFIMVAIGLPLSVLLVAPAIAERYNMTDTAEKTIVFVLAMFGRDILVGFSKLSKQFSADPMSILTFWKKK